MKLNELIINNICDKKENILLIGDGGMGKTTSLIGVMQELYNKENIIPLYIPLYMYNGEKDFIKDTIVEIYLGNILKYIGDSNTNVLIKKTFFEFSDKKFVLLLDGINETPNARVGGLFAEISELDQYANVIFVISSRHDIKEFDESFTRYKLNKLSAEKINEYISVEKLTNSKLLELLKIPFYLMKYKKIRDDDCSWVESAAELLSLFYETQINKLKEPQTRVYDSMYCDYCKIVVFYYFARLAYMICYSGKAPVFSEKASYDLWCEWQNKHATYNQRNTISNCPKYNYLNVLTNLGIISIENGNYKVHQIVLEFFAAIFIKNSASKEDFEIAISGTWNTNVMRNYGELIDEHKAIIQNSPLLSKLELFRNDFEGEMTPATVSNLIEFSKCFHKKIDYDFSNLDLTDTEFRGVDFSGSNFEGAMLREEVFNETGNRYNPYDAALSPDGRFIVTVDMDCVVIWKDSKYRACIETGEQISFLAFHDNETLLIATDEHWEYDDDGDIEISSNRHIWTLNLNKLPILTTISDSVERTWNYEGNNISVEHHNDFIDVRNSFDKSVLEFIGGELTIEVDGDLLSLSQNGDYILVEEGICKLYDNEYRLVKSVPCCYHSYEHYDEKYKISNDGRTIVYKSQKGLYIYNIDNDNWICLKELNSIWDIDIVKERIILTDRYGEISVYDFDGKISKCNLLKHIENLTNGLKHWEFTYEKTKISSFSEGIAIIAIEKHFGGNGRIALMIEGEETNYYSVFHSQMSEAEGINISDDGKYAMIYMKCGQTKHTILFDIINKRVLDKKSNPEGIGWKTFQSADMRFSENHVLMSERDCERKTERYLILKDKDVIYVYDISNGKLIMDTRNIIANLNIVGSNFSNIRMECENFEYIKEVIVKNGGII